MDETLKDGMEQEEGGVTAPTEPETDPAVDTGDKEPESPETTDTTKDGTDGDGAAESGTETPTEPSGGTEGEGGDTDTPDGTETPEQPTGPTGGDTEEPRGDNPGPMPEQPTDPSGEDGGGTGDTGDAGSTGEKGDTGDTGEGTGEENQPTTDPGQTETDPTQPEGPTDPTEPSEPSEPGKDEPEEEPRGDNPSTDPDVPGTDTPSTGGEEGGTESPGTDTPSTEPEDPGKEEPTDPGTQEPDPGAETPGTGETEQPEPGTGTEEPGTEEPDPGTEEPDPNPEEPKDPVEPVDPTPDPEPEPEQEPEEEPIGTRWAEIVTDHAMVFIDDIRLNEMAQDNPARFFRRMTLYMKNAIPLFSRPHQMIQYLKDGLVYPEFADAEWVSTAESVTDPEGFTLQTENIGFDVFSCAVMRQNEDGSTYEEPYTLAQYDPDTGAVKFPQQEEEGLEYLLDWYKDGRFGEKELTDTQKRILGLCVASVWDERFFREWLADAPKVHDRSFNPPNEAQYMEKGMKKKLENRGLLNDELRKYEQDCAYANVVKYHGGTPYSFI